VKRSSKVEIFRIFRGDETREVDKVIHEEEVVLRLNGETRKFCCIPTGLEAMILGNLKSRGMDILPSEIRKTAPNEFEVDALKELARNTQKCYSEKELTSKEVFRAIRMLDDKGSLHKETGCTHIAGICGDGWDFFVEDTSRHCAIDKAIGLAIMDGIDLTNSLLVTSCRQTVSTMKKAVFCRIPIVISIAAPTDLAIKEANKHGITLVGFASSQGFNIYSYEWRIKK
jgi:FdhD protein